MELRQGFSWERKRVHERAFEISEMVLGMVHERVPETVHEIPCGNARGMLAQ